MIYFDGEVSCLKTKDTLSMIGSGDFESLVPSPRGYIALINRRSKLVRLEELSVNECQHRVLEKKKETQMILPRRKDRLDPSQYYDHL